MQKHNSNNYTKSAQISGKLTITVDKFTQVIKFTFQIYYLICLKLIVSKREQSIKIQQKIDQFVKECIYKRNELLPINSLICPSQEHIQLIYKHHKNKKSIMELQAEQKEDGKLVSSLQIIPVDEYYSLRPIVKISAQKQSEYVAKSFILFVIECRSGMKDQGVKILKMNLLDMIEDYLNKGIDGMGFIINQEYFSLRNYKSLEAVKALLINLEMREQVSFEKTLVKLRHTIVSQVTKLENKKLTLIFFSSPVDYDKLNPLKQSYVSYLNRHKFDYYSIIQHLKKTIKKTCVDSQAYVLAFSGSNNQVQPIDYDFLYELTYCTHRYGIFKYANSYAQLDTGLKQICASSLYQLSILMFNIPKIVSEKQITDAQEKHKTVNPYFQLKLRSTEYFQFQLPQTGGYFYVKKQKVDLQKIKYRGFFMNHKVISQETGGWKQNIIQGKEVDFHEPTFIESINCKVGIYSMEMRQISFKLINQVINLRKVRDPNNEYHFVKDIDEQMQFQLRQRIEFIDKKERQIYDILFSKFKDKQFAMKQSEKSNLFSKYSYLKNMLDETQFTLSQILKQQISQSIQIGKLASAITSYNVKRSLRNKLVKRINGNPRMLDEIYERIHQICYRSNPDYYSWEAKYRKQKSEVGNCFQTDCNFVTSYMQEDCLAIMFQVERPDAAIADPGRLRMRQISPFVVRVSQFFQIHYYGVINQSYDQKQGDEWIRQYSEVYKQGYKQMWDYWNRADNEKTAIGLMPLYITKQNWKVAKLLMKPCLAWTACAQPLAYTFSQTQTIPFMVLSFLIRKNQQLKYKINELEIQAASKNTQIQLYMKQHQRNGVKLQQKRMEALLKHTHLTCQELLKDLSAGNFEEKMIDQVIRKYKDYENPRNRTVDVINSNASFIAQLYCAITTGLMQKPSQNDFHQFFKRLVQEQLRRQTDGWNEQQVQQKFINKLLNSQVQLMVQPKYQVLDSAYRDNFQAALQGVLISRTEFEIQRDNLAMVLKKNDKFNNTQRLILIQYKRLYENRVLWMWYVRFLIYGQKQRLHIHKWICLDLKNSYQLFTMIIQNKKQRKNYKRREAIQAGEYADPFDYYQARQFLQSQFMKIRAKKQGKNIQILYGKKYDSASAVFADTLDLKEAAGSLMNIQIGKQIKYYFAMLMKGEAKLLHQKLRMLLLNNYMGVQLIRSKSGQGWKMSKKKTLRLQLKYKAEFSRFRYMM